MGMTRELIWIGDGFNKAKDQIGKVVKAHGLRGVVVGAGELSITVKLHWWWPRNWLPPGKLLWRKVTLK
jgi:hypothetical protein